MIFEGISGRIPDPSRGFQPGPAPRRGDSGGTGGGRGGVAEARYHLDRGWQPWPTRSTSSFQEGEGPQRVGGLAPNAVMPRALLCVRAGPRGEAAPSHPRRALAGGEVVLSRDRGCCEAWKSGSRVYNHVTHLQAPESLQPLPRADSGQTAPGTR